MEPQKNIIIVRNTKKIIKNLLLVFVACLSQTDIWNHKIGGIIVYVYGYPKNSILQVGCLKYYTENTVLP